MQIQSIEKQEQEQLKKEQTRLEQLRLGEEESKKKKKKGASSDKCKSSHRRGKLPVDSVSKSPLKDENL